MDMRTALKASPSAHGYLACSLGAAVLLGLVRLGGQFKPTTEDAPNKAHLADLDDGSDHRGMHGNLSGLSFECWAASWLALLTQER